MLGAPEVICTAAGLGEGGTGELSGRRESCGDAVGKLAPGVVPGTDAATIGNGEDRASSFCASPAGLACGEGECERTMNQAAIAATNNTKAVVVLRGFIEENSSNEPLMSNGPLPDHP